MNFTFILARTINHSVLVKKTFVLLLFLIFIDSVSGQSLKADSISFIDYNNVIKDLKLNDSQSSYYSDLDFKKIISLDKSTLTTLLKINPEILNEKDIDTARINYDVSEKYTQIIDIDVFSLKYILNSKDLRDLFLAILVGINYQKGIEIENHIYRKENVYIFSVFTDFWGETYRLTKKDNQIRAEFLWAYFE